jgi:hypothetical protein
VITTAELHRVAEREGLRFDQVEKDYVILWLLSGLAHSGAKEHGWVFKGGTCLRHCYYEGYRFSEDIDFSCRPGGDNLIRGVQPNITSLTSDTLREWNENAWLHRLGPMLKDVPDFDRLWKEWVKTFHELVKDTK